MLARPATSIREYLTADRTKLTKPVTFVVLTSIIYTIVANFFKIFLPFAIV